MSAERRLGFTLIEAVITMAILGAVCVSALGALSAQLASAERATRAVEAAALAGDRLARLELLDHDELREVPDSLLSGRFDGPFTGYTWSATAEPSRGEPDLFDLSVSVGWESGRYDLASRIYRPSGSRADS